MNLRKVLVITLQLGLLALINRGGYLLTHVLYLRLPGNLVGMLLLFAMLLSRVIRLEWIQEGASILTRHFAFFFIPIAVGLIAFKDVFLQHGLSILGALVASATAGMLLCGLVAQVADKKESKCHAIAADPIRSWYHRIGLRP